MTKVLWKYILKKSFWLYFFTFIIAPSWYLIKMLLSRSLSVEELWAFYWFLSLLTFLTTYNDLWLTQSLSYFIPKYKSWKEIHRVWQLVFSALWFQILWWIIIWIILFSIKNWLVFSYFQLPELSGIFSILIVNFLILSFFEVIIWFFTSIQDTFNHKLVETVKIWSVLLWVIFFYYIWITWIDYLTGYAISWTVWTLFAILLWFMTIYCKYKFYFPKAEYDSKYFLLVKKFIKYSFRIFIWLNAWNISWNINIQMITYFLSSEQAWYYSVFNSLLQIPQLIITPILGFLFTLFSEFNANDDKKNQWVIIEYLYKLFIVLWIAIWSVFLLFWWEIWSTLFGIKYVVSWEYLQIIALFIPIYYIFAINFAILPWLWNAKKRSLIMWIWVLINFIWNLILINMVWIAWAIISTILSRWFCVFYSMFIINKKITIKFDYLYYLKNIVFIFLFFLFIVYSWTSQHIKQASWDILSFIALLLLLTILVFTWIYMINHKEVNKLITIFYKTRTYEK
jgi:O-antigen/teichoic acid export membrane protein